MRDCFQEPITELSRIEFNKKWQAWESENFPAKSTEVQVLLAD